MLQADVKGLYYHGTRGARLLPRHVKVFHKVDIEFPFSIDCSFFHSLSTVQIDPRMAFQIPEKMLAAQVVEVPYFVNHWQQLASL